MNQQLTEWARVGRSLDTSTPVAPESKRPHPGAPNIVMIVLDDLGFGELGCYGSSISTPNIDRLAAEGLRYTNFHVTALCAPTRACLVTGRNHHAVGMGYLADAPMGFPGYTARIPRSAGTLPRLLREAGYSTFAVGKWHLTPPNEHGPSGPFDRWPLGLGFERFYGFIKGMTNQWTPDLVRDNGYIDQPKQPKDGYHVTEDLTSQAIRLVQDQQHDDPDKPFFLYFATGAMHVPHQVPPEWIHSYRGQFDGGWEVARDQTFARQQRAGLLPDTATLTGRPSWVRPWDELTSDERRVFSRQMEVYAGFMSHTDAQIGRLTDFLHRIGVLDNTIIMVLSDNGADGHGGPNGFFDLSLRNEFGHMLENIDSLGGFDAFNGYAWGWAWAGNTPFKLWKAYTWLGGVRVPLIVRWPQLIELASRGQTRSQFCHAIDLMPTILDATSVEAPSVLDGVTQQPLDGRSLVGTFRDPNAESPRSTQYFEMGGSRSIYHQGWKATTDHLRPSNIAAGMEGSGDFATDRWSLYCLEEDYSEAFDLADTEPGRLRELVELWWYEAGRNQVLPLTDALVRSAGDDSTRRRSRYVYTPGGSRIVTPPLLGGFEVTAEITLPQVQPASGVVCAQGGVHGGWACYFISSRLVCFLSFGGPPLRMESTEDLAPGAHRIVVSYIPSKDNAPATARLTVDDSLAASESLADDHTKLAFLSRFAPLLIGRDEGFAVSEDYQPPFAFNGEFGRVILEIPEGIDLSSAHEHLAKNALRHD